MLRIPAVAALLAALAALPATAQVTPGEVWQAWRSGGLDISAAQQRETDGELVLDGVTVALPQGGRMLVGRVVLSPDGEAVQVRATPEARLVGPAERGEGTLSAPDASLRVTGRPGALVHELDAPTLSLDWPGMPGLALALEALSGRVETVGGGVAADLDARSGTLEIEVETGAGRSVSRQSWSAPALAYDGPLAPSHDSPAESRFVTEGSRIASESDNGTLRLDVESTETRATLTGTRIDLSHSSRDTDAVFLPSGGAVPEIAADIASMGLELDGPLVASGSNRPATLDLSLDGITLREESWARYDPDGVLPRDPAAIDLALRADLAPGAGGEGPPYPFERLRIDRASIDALGAAARATGTLAFPEAPAAPGQPPRPEGVIDLTLENVSGLVDDLAAAGILGEAQALFARLGLEQVTRPGEGGTEREAEIVFEPDGSISLGGLTLR